MAGIIGYGEDALTFWAIKNRLDEILTKLGDRYDQSDCIVFYRPSFGRGGRSTASFGEFDAIVSTMTHVYLIESKWEVANRSPKRRIKLSEAQCNRHKIFAEYFGKWNDAMGKLSLTAGKPEEHLHNIPTKKIVSTKNELANHLQFVISRIATRRDNGIKKELKNVLLFLHREEDEDLSISVEPEDFTLVMVKCPSSIDLEGDSWFFDMEGSLAQ